MNAEDKPEGQPKEPKRLQGFIDQMVENIASYNDNPDAYDDRKWEQESKLRLGKVTGKKQTDEKPAMDNPSP